MWDDTGTQVYWVWLIDELDFHLRPRSAWLSCNPDCGMAVDKVPLFRLILARSFFEIVIDKIRL